MTTTIGVISIILATYASIISTVTLLYRYRDRRDIENPVICRIDSTPYIRDRIASFCFTIQNRSASKSFIDRIYLQIASADGSAIQRRQINSNLRLNFKEVYEPSEQSRFNEVFEVTNSEIDDLDFSFDIKVYHSRSENPARTVTRDW